MVVKYKSFDEAGRTRHDDWADSHCCFLFTYTTHIYQLEQCVTFQI